MAAVASQIIGRELEPGETLLWSGQPRKGVVFRSSDIFFIPFSLMWGGFAIFWEASVLSLGHKTGHQAPLFFSLWGIPFVLLGLYLIFGRFIVDALQRKNTYYGLTDRRVIILTGISSEPLSLDLATLISAITGLARRKVKSLDLRTLTDISMTEGARGTGSITFGTQVAYSFFSRGWPSTNSSAGPAFDPIEHVTSVYEQIRAAQRKAS